MIERRVDILIIGGGIVGAAMLRTLQSLGHHVLLVDERVPTMSTDASVDGDRRSITLSYASIKILEQLDVWPLVSEHATSIETIHVSERGAFGHTTLKGTAGQLLGAVVEMDHLKAALHATLDSQHCLMGARVTAFDAEHQVATIHHQANVFRVEATLVIAADGTDSSLRNYCDMPVRRKPYAQYALVTTIGLRRPHQNVAYERFMPSGPIALLPMRGLRAGLVWVQSPEEAQRLQTLSETDFLSALQCAFGYRLGRFMRVGPRQVYPLHQVIMPQQVRGGVVFIGNAAHTIHPVAGQGFNLSMRDVAMLAQCIAELGINTNALQQYQQRRVDDHQVIQRLTDGLITLYGSHFPGVACVRRLGLLMFDNSTWLKAWLSRYASGLGGVVPDLVCGIPLKTVL